jgi:Rab proteins geranylgeranyltransferase component A
LTLSPHLIYSQSGLLPALVSSRLHNQLEFQAVGPWWICKDGPIQGSDSEGQNGEETSSCGVHSGSVRRSSCVLQKIPSTREDVFADDTLSPRDKRSLMKFLRSIVIETRVEAEPIQDTPPSLALATLYAMAPSLQQPLLALSLSYDSAGAVTTRSIASRIRRHMRSIGAFGPGFGAVMPKYGGAAEIAQVACRASAVGGAVYVLGQGLKKISDPDEQSAEIEAPQDDVIRLELSDGEEIKARLVAGCAEDFPMDTMERSATNPNSELVKTVHSISIVSLPLEHLFPPTSESGPVPAGAVVVYGGDEHKCTSHDGSASQVIPVYMVVHSSESGECPAGQCKCNLPLPCFACYGHSSSDDHIYEYLSTLSATSLLITISDNLIGKFYSLFHQTRSAEVLLANESSAPGVIYASTLSQPGSNDDEDIQRLGAAVARLLEASMFSDSKPEVLWSLKYRARGRSIDSGPGQIFSAMAGRVMIFPPPSIDPAFDDSILENVKEIWKRAMGDEADEADFLKFEERGVGNEEELLCL